MIISIASGKGGTGKTTLAVNLALSDPGFKLLDCDVEEPNCHIFLDPEELGRREVTVKVPKIDDSLCDYCGRCADFCQYNALAVSQDVVMKFPELCHSCGGCALVCPKDAITEQENRVGEVVHARKGELKISYGVLDTGQAMASPVIRQLKGEVKGDTLIDAPPGTSCATIEAVKDSDFCLLVTEPTPFGLYDLKLAVKMLETIGLDHAVVVNRDGIGDNKVQRYCEKKDIPILLRLPYDPQIARLYSEGIPFTQHLHEYRSILKNLLEDVRRR